VADPNNPTALHRAMKAMLLKMLSMQNPGAYDMIAVDKRVLSMANIDSNGIFAPPQQAGPDPVMMAMQARMQMMTMQVALRNQEQQLKAALSIQEAQGKAADRASREHIEKLKLEIADKHKQMEILLERLKINAEAINQMRDHAINERQTGQEMALKTHETRMDMTLRQQEMQHKQTMDQQQHQQAMHQQQQQHEQQMRMNQHQQNMDHANFGHGAVKDGADRFLKFYQMQNAQAAPQPQQGGQRKKPQ
jgi:hypothetical protein